MSQLCGVQKCHISKGMKMSQFGRYQKCHNTEGIEIVTSWKVLSNNATLMKVTFVKTYLFQFCLALNKTYLYNFQTV